ncbi:MAG: response regulator, partial [bacterium]|nr:response regulator [bacterium]
MYVETERERLSRVLLVEDDEAQRITLTHIVEQEGYNVLACGTAAAALGHVRQANFGVAVVDLRLPDLEGTQLLERLHTHDEGIRVIIHTAYGSFDSAKESVNKGAFAYVEKAGDPNVLVQHVHRASRERLAHYAGDLEAKVAQRTEALRETNQALSKSEQKYRTIFDTAAALITSVDGAGTIVDCNPRARDLLGYDPEEIIGQSMPKIIHPDCADQSWKTLNEIRVHGFVQGQELRMIRKDGATLEVSINSAAIYDAEGEFERTICVITDITERKRAIAERERLEAGLRQAQKMEAIGTLAAGVAHEFNNFLTAIMGYTDVARLHINEHSDAAKALSGIDRAAQQASRVTRSLLTLGRKGASKMQPVHLGELITEVGGMLRGMLPATIRLEVSTPDDAQLWVEADATQLQQVIINLAINARDAMPEGGHLHLSLAQCDLDWPDAPQAEAGEDHGAVCMVVEDNGTGMSEETCARLFEPFFSTKPRGRGSGLGMAIVHGIVGDHHGHLDVETRPGLGTRVDVRIPRCEPGPDDGETPAGNAPIQYRRSTVMVVDDEPQVLALLTSALRAAGFEVIQAATGSLALDTFESSRDHVR